MRAATACASPIRLPCPEHDSWPRWGVATPRYRNYQSGVAEAEGGPVYWCLEPSREHDHGRLSMTIDNETLFGGI